jgi:hypothetical protein
MDTVTLKHILKTEMQKYAGEASNGNAYLTISDDEQTYALIAISFVQGKRYADSFLIARIVDNRIEIEYDGNDKTLDDALLSAGVPPAQIVLRYQEIA